MDERDAAIIRVIERLLKELSSRAIAKEVGLPTSTVHRRMRKLEQDGVIIGYKAVINYDKTDRPISANLLINLSEPTSDRPRISKSEIIDKLKEFKEITEIINIQGYNFDLVVRVRCSNIKQLSLLSEELSSLKGVERVATAIIVEEVVV